MTSVKIVVEKVDNGFVATPYDDVGAMGSGGEFSTKKRAAISLAIRRAREELGPVEAEQTEFRVEEVFR